MKKEPKRIDKPQERGIELVPKAPEWQPDRSSLSGGKLSKDSPIPKPVTAPPIQIVGEEP